MHDFFRILIAGTCILAPAISRADGDDAQEVARDLGAVLAWRLGPGILEERCREPDPEGAESRLKSLSAWQRKNAALIADVDARVAEVAPRAFPSPDNDSLQQVQAQVRKVLLEAIFSGKSAEEVKAICKAESDPANPRWNSNGKPHVQESLAALYDWNFQHK